MSEQKSDKERLTALEVGLTNLKEREQEDRDSLKTFKRDTFKPFADKTDQSIHKLWIRVSMGFGLLLAFKFVAEKIF